MDAGAQGLTTRKIIHIDMDAFYASVEQRDNPDLHGKPVAVGGARERGVVAAASYEAREFGVRSAMPSVTALRKCPDLIFVRPRFEVYKAVSAHIRSIFMRHTPLIEPLSLDEAYLDVTDHAQGSPATDIASNIRAQIKAETGLTASAGISYNKFLAKLASDHNKPDGQFVIRPSQGADFAKGLKIEKFHGIGPATARRMHALGIFTGKDLAARPLAFLVEHFGKAGPFYHAISHGIDERPVRPNRIRKSLGAENTFMHDIHDYGQCCAALEPLLEKVWHLAAERGLLARGMTLKVKFADFRQITRSLTLETPLASQAHFRTLVLDMLASLFPVPQGIRLLGVSLSSFGGIGEGSQLILPL
jgi:DNA polymerase IV